jgi:ribonuclease HII
VTQAARPIDHYERLLQEQGFLLVAGVDEAGRGALAGPLVAAAAILPEGFGCVGLRDSKELTPAQREEWFVRITGAAVSWSVCRAYPSRIDHRGLHRTNVWLLRRALTALDVRPDFAISDGFSVRPMGLPSLSVKKGDETCASVAAASIIAKVTRDHAMDRYHRRFPQYGFDHNRGYGTGEHRAAIARHGPTPIHRMSFRGMDMYTNEHAAYVAAYGRPDGEPGGTGGAQA